jgi:hypothetical protein
MTLMQKHIRFGSKKWAAMMQKHISHASLFSLLTSGATTSFEPNQSVDSLVQSGNMHPCFTVRSIDSKTGERLL